MLYIAVGMGEWGRVGGAEEVGELRVALQEEVVVELHDLAHTAAVHLQLVRILGSVEAELAVDLAIEDAPVATSPAVDGLLHIAHEHALVTSRESLAQDVQEVVPLHA